ncbi:hypothetical protein Tco_1392928 [Tanacetum coccineum]
MFQQHHEESLSKAWTHFKDLLQKVPHHGIDLWLQVQIFYDHVNPVTRQTINQSAGGKLRDLNAEESWAFLEDLALYDNKSLNDPRDFTKPVKAIALPQDVPSTSDRRLIKLENQICSGPHDTQYCMEDPEQAFVEYASSRTDEAGGGLLTSISSLLSGRRVTCEYLWSELEGKWNWIDPRAIEDEDERGPMFIQPHDPDFVPEPIYLEYIPLEDEHVFPVEEQPLPPVVSPTAESPRYVIELDPEEDPEEFEDDEIEDGPVDYHR